MMFSKFFNKYIIPNNKLILFYIGYLVLVFMLRTKFSVELAKTNYADFSLADNIIMSLRYDFFPICVALMSIFVTASIMRNDFKSSFVIRYSSKRKFWNEQAKTIIILALAFSTVILCILIISGLFTSTVPVNFNDNNSLMRYFVKAIRRDNIPVELVILASWISTSLILVILNFIVLLSKWIFSNTLCGFIIVIAVCSFGTIGDRLNVLLEKFYIDYKMWFNPSEIFINFIGLALMATIIYVIGLMISKRKEFLNAKD